VIWVHGNNGDYHDITTGPTGQITQAAACRDALTNAGYIIATTTTRSTTNWGNQASVDDIADLYNYCASHYNIADVLLIGQSMGGLDSLLSLSEGKIPAVRGWLGVYPVCNLANLYTNAGFTGLINTAFGITGTGTLTYANLTFGHDPLLKWGNVFRNVPMRFYASAADTLVPKSSNADLLAALVLGSTRENSVVVCSGNHGDPSHFQASDWLAFAQRCFATPIKTSGGYGGTKRKVQ
jgi:acetyl esterase/lipase